MFSIKTLLALGLAGFIGTSVSAAPFSGSAVDGDTTSFTGTIGDTLSLVPFVDPTSYYFLESLTLTFNSGATWSLPHQVEFTNGIDGAIGNQVGSPTVSGGITTVTFDFGAPTAWSNGLLGGSNPYSVTVHDLTPNVGSLTFAVTAVPEPESYAMLLAGLGALGFMARRRKSAQ